MALKVGFLDAPLCQTTEDNCYALVILNFIKVLKLIIMQNRRKRLNCRFVATRINAFNVFERNAFL